MRGFQLIVIYELLFLPYPARLQKKHIYFRRGCTTLALKRHAGCRFCQAALQKMKSNQLVVSIQTSLLVC